MRQLPTEIFTAYETEALQTIVKIYVPKSSWFPNKSIFCRYAWFWTQGTGPMPAGYHIDERIQLNGLGTSPYPGQGTMLNGLGNSSSITELRLVRQDPYISFGNIGSMMARPFIDDSNSVTWWDKLPVTVTPTDFNSAIEIDQMIYFPGTWPGATVQVTWAEAFLEQGTNLGTLA